MREVDTYIELDEEIKRLTAKKKAIGDAIKAEGDGEYFGEEDNYLVVTTNEVGRRDQKAVTTKLSANFITRHTIKQDVTKINIKKNEDKVVLGAVA